MQFVWDERKRLVNLEKHGFDFQDIGFFDWQNALVEPAGPDAFGRARFKAIGSFRDGTAAAIFGFLGTEAISIISFRQAGPKERKRFDAQT